jgi:hypothetical protein
MGEWSMIAVPASLVGVSLFAALLTHVESRVLEEQ